MSVAPVLIRIVVEQAQPLAGTATTEGRDPVPFEGWLELLRVLSELIDAAPAPLEEGAAEPAGSSGGRDASKPERQRR